MTKSYSLDLRHHVTDAIAGGLSCRAAARRFAVSASTAIGYQQRLNRTSCAAPFKRGRPLGSGKLAPHREMLVTKVEEQSDITMPELALFLFERAQVSITASNLSKLLRKAGYTYKKRLMASEQERSDICQEREAWGVHILSVIIRDIERVIFIDETCVKTNMIPLRGRSLKGKRLNVMPLRGSGKPLLLLPDCVAAN